MKRDSQRKKLYTAERAFWEDTPVHNFTPESVEELEQQVRSIWKDPAVRKAFPEITERVPRVELGKKRGGAFASPWRNLLGFSRRDCQPWIVVHELSHLIHFEVTGDQFSKTEAWHGPEFAAVYLLLTEICYGFEMRQGLSASFREHRVKIAPQVVRKG